MTRPPCEATTTTAPSSRRSRATATDDHGGDAGGDRYEDWDDDRAGPTTRSCARPRPRPAGPHPRWLLLVMLLCWWRRAGLVGAGPARPRRRPRRGGPLHGPRRLVGQRRRRRSWPTRASSTTPRSSAGTCGGRASRASRPATTSCTRTWRPGTSSRPCSGEPLPIGVGQLHRARGAHPRRGAGRHRRGHPGLRPGEDPGR